jgi:hypothetical protein
MRDNGSLTELRLNRGELSSISLSSSSKSVSKMVASDIGRGANVFMLKNVSVGCPFWNISTLGSMGVMGSILVVRDYIEPHQPCDVCDVKISKALP